jgi:hypothetical protein
LSTVVLGFSHTQECEFLKGSIASCNLYG